MVSSSVQRAIQSAAGGNVEAIAKVQLFEGSSGSWVFTELEGHAALVSQSGAHILKIFEGETTVAEFEQELYPGMTYNTNCPHFHYFETDEFVAGLSFGSDSEASQFGSAVKRSIPSPSSSSSSSATISVSPPPTSSASSSSSNNHGIVNRELGVSKSSQASTSSPALTPAKASSSTNVQAKSGGGGGGGGNWKKKFAGFGEKFSAKVSEVFTAESKEPEDFVLSGPTGFRHESHIGWDPENGFDVKNIPPEWRKLFQAAGVKKSELQDANTAKFIMQTVTEAMSTSGQGAPPPPPGGGPPPPPPPPGPPPPMGGPPPPGPGPNMNRPPPSGGGGGDLLSQIQQGTQLKKVEEPDLRELDQGKQTTLANTLAAAMAARRGGVSGEANEEEDEWDDDWDD